MTSCDTAIVRSVAIIDLGSNTARLVALTYEQGRRYQMVDELSEVVRLSQGMEPEGLLRPEPFERGIKVLRTFKSYCDAVGIHEIRATATSAVRSARNGAEFIDAARRQAGITLRVLPGEEEASAGCLAVANSLSVTDAVVFDLGGGSMQLSLMRDRRFVGGTAYPLGAVRTSEAFITTDPPKKRERKALAKHVGELLRDQLRALPPGLPVVGMGGTLRNLAGIVQARAAYQPDLLHGFVLRRDALEALVDELAGMSTAQRRAIEELNDDRADIIVAGAVVIVELMRGLRADEVVISGQGLREGLFYPYLIPQGDHLVPDLREFSALNLMREYYDNPAHNHHVRRLALQLFDQLAAIHQMGAPERELLSAAALVHDIGMAVDYYGHHKHGMYLVMGRSLPGYSHREQTIIGLLVRYHRRGNPKDEGYGVALGQEDVVRLRALAAVLRVAEYLERGKAQRVKGVRCVLDGGLVIEALAEGDVMVEVSEANAHCELLASVLRMPVHVVAVRTNVRTDGGATVASP